MLPRVTPQVLTPALRVLGRSAVPAALVMVAAPVAVTLARRGTDLQLASFATALLGGSVVALAVEDPFDTPASAAPVSLPWRRGLRLTLVAAAVLVVWSVTYVAARADGVAIGPIGRLVPPTAAVATVAVAVALGLARRGDPSPGLSGASAALLLVLTSTALAQYEPRFPTLLGPPGRWWWVAAGAAGFVLAWWRDPAARPPTTTVRYLTVGRRRRSSVVASGR